ncbi:hypothetical protein ASPFODRAFT_90999, partial [Aspergillus luchuensis CBS 106.47]
PRSRLLQCMHTGTYFCDVTKELRAPISNELLLTLLLWLVGRVAAVCRVMAWDECSLSLEQKHGDDKNALQALRTVRK